MPRKPKAKERPWNPGRRGHGERMENRPRSAAEYHTARWTRESREFRAAHPLCEECLRRGVARASEVVDHVVPVGVCRDFWDRSNWQALCRKCNIEKGNRDKRLRHGE